MHEIPNPFSLSRENVGRSRSSVTIGFVRCRLLRGTGCHGAPVLSCAISKNHWCGIICAARGGKDVCCNSIGKGRTPLAEILVERWCAVEHAIHACNLARIPTSHSLVERWCIIEHVTHASNLARIPTSHGLVERWCAYEHGSHACNLARIPIGDVIVKWGL